MPNAQPLDILAKLNRLLIITPEHAFAVPPVARQTIVQAATEIAALRRRIAEIAEIEAQHSSVAQQQPAPSKGSQDDHAS